MWTHGEVQGAEEVQELKQELTMVGDDRPVEEELLGAYCWELLGAYCCQELLCGEAVRQIEAK